MADLNEQQAAGVTKLTGADSAGVESNYVQATAAGGLHANLRDASGNELLGIKTSALSVPFAKSEDPAYSAVAAGFVCASAATDVFTIQGSATKTIRITKIKVSGSTTSGSAIKLTAQLIKRSAANTGGTSVVDANVPHDSSSAAATAVVRHYTANPSALGAAVGPIRADSLAITASGLTGGVIEWNFEVGQPLILRGVSQFLAINFSGVTITGPVISISVEWCEV